MNYELKTALACAIMAISLLPAAAQTEKDYKEAYDKAKEKEQKAVRLEKYPGGFDFSLSLGGNKHSGNGGVHTDLFSSGLGIGFINAVNAPTGMDINMSRSVELSWSNAVGLGVSFHHRHQLTAGIGFLWRNYRMTNQTRFVEDAQGLISLQPYPAGANPNFSRLHVFYTTVPLKYIYRAHHGWKFGLGPEFAFNAGCNKHTHTIKTRYKVSGQKMKDMTRDVHVNSFNMNLMAHVEWKDVGLYVRYSPNNVFDKEYGPEFQSFSVGVMLFGF